MKKISIKIILLFSIFSVHSSSAQSLQNLINTALQNNYQISILKNEAQIATNNNVVGNTGMLPSISLDGTYTYKYNITKQDFADGTIREGNDANNTNINIGAMINWTAFNGFRVYAKRDQLKYLEQLGAVNSKFYIEQTVADIVTAYNQIVFEKQLLKNYEESLEISIYRLKLEEKRKEVGVGKAMDYGLALVDYQTDKIRLLTQQNNINALEIKLNNILNNNLEAEVLISDETFSFIALPAKDSLLQNVMNANQELEQQRLQELIAETELRIAKADRAPKIDLFAGFQYARSTAAIGFVNANQGFGPLAGISISYNLFNGGAVNRAVKNTNLYVENTSLNKQQIKQQVDADVLNLYNQYTVIADQIVLATSNIEEMTKVYNAAEEQLRKGAINGYDFRLTQLSLLNTELSLIQMQYTLKAIEVNLNRLSGKVLETYL